MRLINLEIFGIEGKWWIDIEGEKIYKIGPVSNNNEKYKGRVIEFENAIALPGLINSHDHLEFSLFPKLGNKKYKDYVEWGEDIHKNNKNIINEVLKIPLDMRIEYGIYKNILNGVTTVVHHGGKMSNNKFLIDVFAQYNYLHSVRLGKNWRLKLLFKKNDLPFLIHIGEGTNVESFSEINKFIKWNLLKKTLVGIHGISMNTEQAEQFKALVWCPVSNNFLYGVTAPIDKLKSKTKILFGTDSNVSAGWNLWDHIRFAKKTHMLDDVELYNALLTDAVKVWNLKDKGSISPGFNADLIIAEKKAGNHFDSFYGMNPENIIMLIKNGSIISFDSQLTNQVKIAGVEIPSFTGIKIGNRNKFVKGRLDNLNIGIRKYSSSISFPFEII